MLPAIKSGTTKAPNDLNNSNITENLIKSGIGNDIGRQADPYNNTMVEFGSIRQS